MVRAACYRERYRRIWTLGKQGLSFRLRLGEAQNIGFFPDMAEGRKLVRERAADKRVLNLFAYSCSFSVAALAGGATQVVNLDMNRGALELGKLNHRINDIDLRQASFLPLEFFRSLSKLRKLGPFDLVICDPPASQGKSFTAEHHWPKLVRTLPELVSPAVKFWPASTHPTSALTISTNSLRFTSRRRRNSGMFTPGDDFPEADMACGVTLHLYRRPLLI